MRKYSFILILYVTSVLSWTILSENLSLSSVGLGFILATFVLAFTQDFISDSKMPAIRLEYFIKMIGYSFKTIASVYVSAFKVMKGIFLNKFDVSIVEVELPSDLGFVNALVCNSITLTPGTLSLEKNKKKAHILLLNPDSKSLEELVADIESSYQNLSGS
ncbi:putative monovalent cation/H+ antiporter subunit E [Andreesenia angusta]|uniref:Putative monovalent cation/H+ antiporter subunit E n=1 Tax=Andreesenia angusta TaxID=39480 RepID=A0A1S1V9H2_9FIRM|nr:Na+/H+ antiporter subunit E [Andreesenia angusta]OHW63238.1 putative monovalent cation/H+ antiporter subunit E [Andreesenia angusta]